MTAVLSLPFLISLIVVALAFDFLNGVHDTANSIATIVSTRMLQPRYAVCSTKEGMEVRPKRRSTQPKLP
jgi:hypothetical protein